ncbi:glycosyltransferase family 39 protein [Chitinophaga pendula]|uniref:glycosyltransferase family 39 protein n=1 Tax=Chitinophaga TaxID=79328 RepID=UPI000BAF8CC1|nr:MULTISPECIES: glycosyltransferase family 39 protein [Chitinophaga]ASZ11903.1 hypothetical protein CK934_13515 [Chitinophaga sp. MD30]UCJ05069.1 glycosyltransferase family 39 protein [Chitinophaga pendula]
MERAGAEQQILPTDRFRSHLLLKAVGAIVILRWSFVGLMGLMPQDAYYAFYGQHPALSYFDHPGGIAWILKSITFLFGKKVWALKLADTIITTATITAFYALAKCFLSTHKAIHALLFLLSTLMITVLSLVSTPDVPLLLCWTLTLLCCYQAVFRQRNTYWIWTGIAMGLAFNSKYTAAALPLGILLFLLSSPPHRKHLSTPWPWISLGFALLTTAPVWIWNIQHGFASIRFQSTARAADISLNLPDVLGVIGHQALLIMPVLFCALLYFIYRNYRRYKDCQPLIPAAQLFLLCFFLPTFLGFFLISPFYWIKLNWMMPAYITGIIWVSQWLSKKQLYWQWICTAVIHIAVAIEIIWYPIPVKSDDIWLGWKELSIEINTLQSRYPQDFVFSADSYKTSAVLNVYLDSTVYAANILGEPALQFDFIGTNLQALEGRNALFINSVPDIDNEESEIEFAANLQPYFENVMPLPTVIVRKGDRIIRKFLVYRCYNYRPPGKEDHP